MILCVCVWISKMYWDEWKELKEVQQLIFSPTQGQSEKKEFKNENIYSRLQRHQYYNTSKTNKIKTTMILFTWS